MKENIFNIDPAIYLLISLSRTSLVGKDVLKEVNLRKSVTLKNAVTFTER